MKNLPQTANGDNIIAFLDAKTIRGSLVENDASSLARWYAEDPDKNYLGLLSILSNATNTPLPAYQGMFAKAGIINVNGVNGTFSYGLPIAVQDSVVTTEDTSVRAGIKPGIDNALFPIVLNQQFSQGDVITYDVQRGCQVFISNDVAPRKLSGADWEYYVRMVRGQRAKYFPSDKLKPGVRYWKIGHGLGEFSTQYSKVTGFDKAGQIRCEYRLGTIRGVEGEVTRFAGEKLMNRANAGTLSFVDAAMKRIEALAKNGVNPNLAVIGSTDDGTFRGINPKTAKVATLMEIFCLAELAKIESLQLMFQRGGVVMDNNGPVYLNEGAYHQIRRGPTVHYARPGGITLSHLQEAADYLFRLRPDLPIEQRRIKFRGGRNAVSNVYDIVRTAFYDQLDRLSPLLGDSRVITNPITGGNGGLVMNPVMIEGAFLPGIGTVTVEEEPSFNWSDMVDRGSMVDGMVPYSSYSLVIEDVTDPEFTNAFESIPMEYKSIVPGDNKNVYLVKPYGPSMYWGTTPGRWSSHSTTGEVIGSCYSLMAEQFWCNSTSSMWIPDPSRHFLIELAS